MQDSGDDVHECSADFEGQVEGRGRNKRRAVRHGTHRPLHSSLACPSEEVRASYLKLV